jgi:uncharacterized protein (DUF2267 family)
VLYRTLVKRVQDYSMFSEQEAETALRLIIEIIASRLELEEQIDFANQLPMELKMMVLSMRHHALRHISDDIYQELSQLQNIDTDRAKRQLRSVWQALDDVLSEGQINHIAAQMPEELVEELH